MKQTRALGDNRIIPTVVANSVRGMTDNRTHLFMGKEIIGFISVGPTTTPGILATIKMNPLLMGAVRLQNFCQNFQQYRFTKLRATVRGNLPTTVAGDLYLAYTRNPDHEILDNVAAPNNVFAIESSVVTNLWTATEFECRCNTNQWYNVDPDSSEQMVTTHGAMFIATAGGFNITQQFSMPLFLDYVVECRGQQVQGGAEADSIIFPATQYFGPADGSGAIRMNIAPGESISYPWNRGMKAQEPYFCQPSPIIQGLGDGDESEAAQVVVWDGNTSGYFRFYTTYENWVSGEPIRVMNSTVYEQERFVIEPAYPTRRLMHYETSFRHANGREFRRMVPLNPKAALQASQRCPSCIPTDLISF